ncbi:hypothetical protein GLOIN_2v1650551 [Rhizophagus irregularis DAOM 181602=DAOM 197198]|nr:hypothetical protein GLOIN_2v1650551 [Rhizophagus irregularis DAOM 181602=DAOM 197198]
MWPSNDQDTGDINPGKKFIINLKENHELWDRDGLEQLQEASSRDELVEQQQAPPPPLTSSEQYQLVAKNEIMLNDIQECDDFIQRLKNERVNEHLAFRRQISALKEDCNRLRRERNAAHHRAEGMIVLLRNRDNSRNPPSSV